MNSAGWIAMLLVLSAVALLAPSRARDVQEAGPTPLRGGSALSRRRFRLSGLFCLLQTAYRPYRKSRVMTAYETNNRRDYVMRELLALVVTIILIGVATGSVDAQVPAFPHPAKWNSSSLIRIFDQNAGALLSGIYRRGGLDNGVSFFSSFNDMLLPNPNAVNTMEATVTLLDASAVGGAALFPDPNFFPRAELGGIFYWNSTGTGTPTDQTGHVFAAIELVLNTITGLPEARYFVQRCENAACSSFTNVVNNTLGPVSFLQPHRLKVSYDVFNFTFQMDNGTPVVFAAPDAARLPPVNGLKTLRTRLVVPASATASASVLALFDNFALNGAPFESFDAKDLPRVQILPESSTFSSKQSFDLVIMVETAGEPVTSVRLTVNGSDISNVLPQAIHGTLPSGGVSYRFAGVPASVLPLGIPLVLGAEATTASGKTARGFAFWNAVAVSE